MSIPKFETNIGTICCFMNIFIHFSTEKSLKLAIPNFLNAFMHGKWIWWEELRNLIDFDWQLTEKIKYQPLTSPSKCTHITRLSFYSKIIHCSIWILEAALPGPSSIPHFPSDQIASKHRLNISPLSQHEDFDFEQFLSASPPSFNNFQWLGCLLID